jgi:hypothetical protein
LSQIKITDRIMFEQTQLPCDFRQGINKSLRSRSRARNGPRDRMACMRSRQPGNGTIEPQGLTYFISRFGPTSAP